MMNFRIISQALRDTLGAAACGRFRVTGYRGQGHDAEEVRGEKRMVQVYYSAGEFAKSKGRASGSTQHEITFNVDFSVSSPAKANLAVLSNPSATTAQIQAALAATVDASFEADDLLDEISEYAYQILMDARNFDLGLGVGVMSSRWVDRLVKGEPQPYGSLIVLTGQMQYSCQTVEEILGDTPVVAGANSVTTTLDIIGDDVEQTLISNL